MADETVQRVSGQRVVTTARSASVMRAGELQLQRRARAPGRRARSRLSASTRWTCERVRMSSPADTAAKAPGARAAGDAAARARCAGSRCGRCGTSRRLRGAGSARSRPVETVRDRDDRRASSSGNATQETIDGFRRAHDDRGCRAEERAHPPAVKPPMEHRRVDHHLVERPGIPEIGDPWLSRARATARRQSRPRRTAASRRRSGRSSAPASSAARKLASTHQRLQRSRAPSQRS